MERYFGPDGLLARSVPHFEYRAPQLHMAKAVGECLQTEAPLLAEAGTGTGKTWAYLIPALLSGKRVVVSTGTKTLQDQILDHDVPLLRKILSPQFQVVCVKGRRNYLCRRRFREFSFQPTFWNKDEARLFRRFQTWAARTSTGDRAEMEWLPDNFQTWNDVTSGSEQCLGQGCDDHGRCFLTRLRAEAARANLLVVNHHLFFADLALRRGGAEGVLPPYQGVIFDEAHQIEDIVGLYFGHAWSSTGLQDLMRDVLKECQRNAKKNRHLAEIQRAVQAIDPLVRSLLQSLGQGRGAVGRFSLDVDRLGKGFVDACERLAHGLEQLGAQLGAGGNEDKPPALEMLMGHPLQIAHAVRETLAQKQPELVYWYEVAARSFFIHATPVEVASLLKTALFEHTPAVVLTSATLSVAGSFNFVRESLGLPAESREILVPSPFSYEKQAVMYVPARFPTPQDREFVPRMAQEAEEILTRTRGRALFLFTSYRNLNEMHRLLEGRLPYPILVQGQKPKRALLTEFKEKVDSILLATSSFWQGIDVPGEALSCLLIDKLPFEVPDDPIIASRMERLSRQGKNSFYQYQVPRAVIQLKQGVGRLIRSSQDQGVIAIFDVRLLTKGYGRLFFQSLPPCRIVHEIRDIEAFLFSQRLTSDIG